MRKRSCRFMRGTVPATTDTGEGLARARTALVITRVQRSMSLITVAAPSPGAIGGRFQKLSMVLNNE
jgi:hypothetical protein